MGVRCKRSIYGFLRLPCHVGNSEGERLLAVGVLAWLFVLKWSSLERHRFTCFECGGQVFISCHYAYWIFTGNKYFQCRQDYLIGRCAGVDGFNQAHASGHSRLTARSIMSAPMTNSRPNSYHSDEIMGRLNTSSCILNFHRHEPHSSGPSYMPVNRQA